MNKIRIGCTALLSLAIATTVAAHNQGKDSTALPKKGDAVALRGCLRGAALEAADVEGEDSSTPLVSGVTFRLTGKKDLLKDMKQKHDGRIVQVRGTLKSDLQQHAGYGAKLGGMRITIGGPTGGAGARDMEPQRSLPVVDVTTFVGTETSCGR